MLIKQDTYNKTPSQTYGSLVKPLACVSTHISANDFPNKWLSERSFRSPKRPGVKRQEDGWLEIVRKPTIGTSTSASFHSSSIRGRFFSIVCNLGGESRLGLDGPASLDCQYVMVKPRE